MTAVDRGTFEPVRDNVHLRLLFLTRHLLHSEHRLSLCQRGKRGAPTERGHNTPANKLQTRADTHGYTHPHEPPHSTYNARTRHRHNMHTTRTRHAHDTHTTRTQHTPLVRATPLQEWVDPVATVNPTAP